MNRNPQPDGPAVFEQGGWQPKFPKVQRKSAVVQIAEIVVGVAVGFVVVLAALALVALALGV